LLCLCQGDFIRQSRQLRKARRQDIKARFEKFDLNSPTTRRAQSSRRFTFIFDPSGRLTYWWTSIISLAFLYNFWIIIFRFSFHELTHQNLLIWFILDYSCDLLYIMDIMFNFRTAYLEEGVLQTDTIKLRHYYMNTTRFYIDCLCLMPLDFLYLSIGFKSIFRLVKIYRFWTFLDRTERHTNYPNLFRTIVMIHYLLAIFHWNACLIYILHTRAELGFSRRFSFTFNDSGLDYFKAL
jgi:cyclic nucleotide gated channel alpha 3